MTSGSTTEAEAADGRWVWPFCIFASVWNLAALALVPAHSDLAEPVAANLAFAIGGAVTFARFATYGALAADDVIGSLRPSPLPAAILKILIRLSIAAVLVTLAAWLHFELGLSGLPA